MDTLGEACLNWSGLVLMHSGIPRELAICNRPGSETVVKTRSNMKTAEILLLGLQSSVSAISKADGRVLWKTELPTTLNGDDFVTVLSDGEKAFAHTEGRLHCLDLASGRVLWSNELRGYGYGIGSLCSPNGATAPNSAAVQNRILERRSSES